MKNSLLLLLLAMIVCCWSCSEGGEDVPSPTPTPETNKIEISSSPPVFEQKGGTASISFITNTAWTASIGNSTSWATVSPTSGTASTHTLTVTTKENNTYDERNATLTIKAGNASQNVTITQKQKDALTVTSNKIELSYEGGDFIVEAKANVSLTYEIEESAKEWILANESRGLMTKTLNFKAKANEKEELRQGNIILKGGDGLVETITVYQEGEKPTLVITSDEVVVDSDGETIKIELKSNVDYTMVLPGVDWIGQDETRAISAYTHYLTIAPNETYNQRSALVYFQNEMENLKDSISITQLQKDAIIVAKNEYIVAPEEGNLDFSVNANVDFEVSVSVDWIKQNTNSRALTEKKLSFVIAENTKEEIREGEILITYQDLKQKISVKQLSIQDNIYYSLNASDFELVAASKDGTTAFIQTDTTFAFRCLFDSCQTDPIVAYCDSAGVVERISMHDKVYDILYHADGSKLDIQFNNNGKLDLIENIENPYQKTNSRSKTGDVPYSAIRLMNNVSHGIYTIINSYALYFDNPDCYKSLTRYSAPPWESQLAFDFIVTVYGQVYGKLVKEQFNIVSSVMNDYAAWVKKELYGDAVPDIRSSVSRTGNNSIKVDCWVDDADPAKTAFRIGAIVNETGKHLSSRYRIGHSISTYNKEKQFFAQNLYNLPTGKEYKVQAFLAPPATSKYLDGVKCLLDYYQYGESTEFKLLEVKAEAKTIKSKEATIKLSVVDSKRGLNTQLGLYYGTNPELTENDRLEIGFENDGVTDSPHFQNIEYNYNSADELVIEVKLDNLIPDTTYYFKPYIIYDNNIVNRDLSNKTSVTITKDDMIFYGKQSSFKTTVTDNKTLREILIRIYNECNGKNWVHQKNWCSNLPVEEWEGISKEGGYYHLNFLNKNELTGKFVIEDCVEPIKLYWYDDMHYNCYIDELYLKNCPNLVIAEGTFGNCRSIKRFYLDNIEVDDHANENGISLIDFYLSEKLEYLEIRNVKGIGGVHAASCPSLKEMIIENITYKDYSVNGYYYHVVSVHDCDSLINFHIINNNEGPKGGTVLIESCNQLEKVRIEKYERINITNSQMDLLQIGRGGLDIDNDCIISQAEFGPIKVGKLHLHSTDATFYSLEDGMIEGLEFLTAVNFSNINIFKEGSDEPIEFKGSTTLKEIYIEASKVPSMNLNGCINLEKFYLNLGYISTNYVPPYRNGYIDIRNTPKLKTFEVSNTYYLTDILLDEHMNDVNIRCTGVYDLIKVIPDFYTGYGSGVFEYDRRYDYEDIYDKYGNYIKTIYKDNGYGWYYPKEPDILRHARE